MNIIINEEGDGRLDRVLRRMGWHFPQNLFEKWGRQKKMLLNGTPVKSSARVTKGDVLTLPTHAVSMPAPTTVTPLLLTEEEAKEQLLPMIVFEDEGMLILNKPEGLSVQGGTGQRTSIDDILQSFSPHVRMRLTHRIDKETSGLLLIAKTMSTATLFTNMFRDRLMEKTYIARCEGVVSNDQGIINQPIQKISKELRSTVQGEKKVLEKIVPTQDGKEAITAYTVLQRNHYQTLVELSPKTGRMHQLRVHMACLGHPIVGDKKYGHPSLKDVNLPIHRLMLHAWKLSFTLQGKRYDFEAPVPEGFRLYKGD